MLIADPDHTEAWAVPFTEADVNPGETREVYQHLITIEPGSSKMPSRAYRVAWEVTRLSNPPATLLYVGYVPGSIRHLPGGMLLNVGEGELKLYAVEGDITPPFESASVSGSALTRTDPQESVLREAARVRQARLIDRSTSRPATTPSPTHLQPPARTPPAP